MAVAGGRDTIQLARFGDKPKISLQNATRDNREDIVRRWLALLPKYDKEKVLDARDSKGYAAIHYAAKLNRFKILTLLVTSGASTDIATDDEAKLTPLHFSARYLPRYQDDDAQLQENTSQADQDTEVTILSSSKKAVNLFVKFCRLDPNVTAQYGITPLHLACQRGNKKAVEILLEHDNIQIGSEDDNKDTPLHEAALNGHIEIAEILLRRMKQEGISLQQYNSELQTPLHLACREGHTAIVKLILQIGFEHRKELATSQDNELATPLHLACESGIVDIVRLLVVNGAELTTPKKEGVYPIHIAARFGYVEVVEAMLTSCTEILDIGDDFEKTPLHYAAQFNQEKVIEFLVQKGADIEASDKLARTPLMSAAHHGQVGALKLLRNNGACMDPVDDNGKSCVFLAAQANHVHVLKTVMKDKTGAKLALTTDSNFNTPLHIAARKGHLASLRVLLESYANVAKLDARNELGKTPLHLAASYGHVNVVREIISRRQNTVVDEDEDGNTPLHLACIWGHPPVVKILIGANADIEARNATLWTPIDCAAARGHAAVVVSLIDAGADVDPTDKSNVTPLQLAAQEGHLNVVTTLLENNADAGQTDQNGYNALDHAIGNGHEQIAMAIVQSRQWKKALRNTNGEKGNQTTPLRKLIRKMPEVAEEVFNRCTYTNATKDGRVRPESDNYCVTFDYEFLEDFQPRETKASMIKRTFNRTFHRTNYNEVISDNPDATVARRSKFAPNTTRGNGPGFTTDWGPEGFDKDTHPLSIMVESERTDLLNHPLVTNLLKYKWRKFGRGFYIFNLSTYIVFLVALTAFALLVPNPLTQNCLTCSNATLRQMNTTTAKFQVIAFIGNEVHVSGDQNVFNLLFALGILIIAFAAGLLLKELYQFFQFRLKYFSVYNIVELTLYVSSLVLAFTIVRVQECLCPHRVQYQFGAVAVFLAWMNLVLYFRKLSSTGIYVIMFENILLTFLKAILLTSLLVIAFSLAFFMAFYNPEMDSSRASFSTPLRAFFKTATMSTGEFEYDSLFRQNPGGLEPGDELQAEIEFESLARVFWILFIVFMPIILINLLVGLAVDDIKGIQEAAALKRLELQVELVLDLEQKIPLLRRLFTIGKYAKFPNEDNFITRRIINHRARLEKLQNSLNPPQEPIEEVQSQTRLLVSDMSKIRETVSDLAERNNTLERIIRQMAMKQGIHAEDLDNDDEEEEPSISQI